MTKLHLGAVVPNEGARQLAQWIVAQGVDAALTKLQLRAGGSRPLVDRLLTGEVVPAGLLVADIARVTGGQINPRMWRRRATGWWFDGATPAQRRAA